MQWSLGWGSKQHMEEASSEKCSICKDPTENSDFVTRCGHHFHEECLKEWLESSDGRLEDLNFLTASQLESILHETVSKGGDKIEILEKLIIETGVDVNCVLESESKRTALLIACEGGCLVMVDCLIEHGADINITDSEGNSAVLIASKNGNFELFKLLFEKGGSDINRIDAEGQRCIHYACEHENLDILKLILKESDTVDINVPTNRNLRPIHFACKSDSSDAFNLLIDCGAVYDCVDKNGDTPLHLACSAGNLEITKYLLTLGVDINCKNFKGQTALHLACSNGHLATCEELVKNCADVNVYDVYGKTPLREASSYPEIIKLLVGSGGADVNSTDEEGYPLIYFLINESNLDFETCDFLIAHGARISFENIGSTLLHAAAYNIAKLDTINFVYELNPAAINSQDFQGNTPLHRACQRESLEIVSFLIEHGADVNIKNNSGSTPIHEACVYSFIYIESAILIVKLLVEHGAEIDTTNCAGESLLSAACKNNKNSEIIKFLIKAGGDIKSNIQDLIKYASCKCDPEVFQCGLDTGTDAIDIINMSINTDYNHTESGRSPVFFACTGDNFEFFRYLVDRGASLTHRDDAGSMPLHEACKNGDIQVVKFLIEKHGGIDGVNVRNWDGLTPLHFACKNEDCAEVVELLLGLGAEIDVKDEEGSTPLHVACKEGHFNIASVLIERGADVHCADRYGGSNSLNQACFGANLDLIRYIFEMGAKFNFKADDESFSEIYKNLELITFLFEHGSGDQLDKSVLNEILCEACERGELNVIQFLVEQGVDVNRIRSADGYSAMLCAAAHSSEPSELIEYLLQCGADIYGKSDVGDTVLHLLCKRQHDDNVDIVHLLLAHHAAVLDPALLTDVLHDVCEATPNENTLQIIKLLLDRGAELYLQDDVHNIISNGDFRSLEFLSAQRGSDLNFTDDSGMTAMHYACLNGDLDAVKYLYKLGHEIDCKDDSKCSPLHCACQSESGSLALVKFLFEQGVDIDARDGSGSTPMHRLSEHSASYAVVDMMKFLCRNGAEFDAPNDAGMTPLFLACKSGFWEAVRFLVCKGARINFRNEEGATPIFAACSYENENENESVSVGLSCLLLSHGAEVEAKDNYGSTPLHLATSLGKIGVVRWLIDQGVGIDSRNNLGCTALHVACEKGNFKMVRLLIEGGADGNVKNLAGLTPVQLVRESESESSGSGSGSDQFDIVTYLNDHNN